MNHYFYRDQSSEIEYWKQLAHSYLLKLQELEKKIETLKSEQQLCEQQVPDQSNEMLGSISIQNIKVNNIQSGAAFNIAERQICSTKSDMDLGPNSMNIGDNNRMEHQEDYKVKLRPTQAADFE